MASNPQVSFVQCVVLPLVLTDYGVLYWCHTGVLRNNAVYSEERVICRKMA
jgi:hypothetical protein